MIPNVWREWLAKHHIGPQRLLSAREPALSPEEEIEQVLQELEQTRQALSFTQAAADRDYLLYADAQGDLIRMKQRLEGARAEYTRQGQQAVLRELLPVLDNLWRAFQERPGELADHPWVIGVDLVARQMIITLEALGVFSQYGEVGQPFVPQWYEAVDIAVRPDLQEGTIVEVHQPGYILGERVLRPARVTVSALKEPVAARGEGTPR